jgi:hypothetical protein
MEKNGGAVRWDEAADWISAFPGRQRPRPRGLRDLFADPAAPRGGFWRDGPAFGVPAAAGPGRLKVELPTCSVFGRSRGLLPIFQTMVGTSFRTLIADLVAFILPINNFVE